MISQEDELSKVIIGAAIEVHKILGPGLLESAYEECLAHEMALRQLPCKLGILLNFNVQLMKQGIKRVALNL